VGHSSAIIPADTAAAKRNCDRRVNQTSMIPELAPILELNIVAIKISCFLMFKINQRDIAICYQFTYTPCYFVR
jgi:hypothetical protein